MKRLKQSTIKAYTNTQLIKHLDRLDDLHITQKGASFFRVDFSTGEIYKDHGESFLFYCDDNSRDAILNAIQEIYFKLAI